MGPGRIVPAISYPAIYNLLDFPVGWYHPTFG